MHRASLAILTAGAACAVWLACGAGPEDPRRAASSIVEPGATPLLEPETPPDPEPAGPADVPTTEAPATDAGGGSDPGPRAAPGPGLWAGDLVPGRGSFLPPWLSVRIEPGRDPDVDPWRLEAGPMLALLPPALECLPAPTERGWRLSRCRGLVDGDLTALVPYEPGRKAEVTLSMWGARATARLIRVPTRAEPASSDNVEVLWHQPGSGLHSDIWAADGLVFAPRLDGAVEIIDAATGEILGEALGPDSALDVKAAGGILHVATTATGMWSFDVSDPASPRPIGRFKIPPDGEGREPEAHNFHNIALSPDGRTVYVINNSDFGDTDLTVVDVSDPANPVRSGRYRLDFDAGDPYGITHDVQVVEAGGRLIAYLNYLTAGLLILDVTDPEAISVLGSAEWDGIFSHSGWPFSAGGRDYYAHTSEGFDRHMTVLDVTDPSAPGVVSRFSTRRGVSIHNVQVAGGIAYVSYYIDGLRVIDLRDPHSPREVAHFDTVPEEAERGILQGAWGVMVLDGVVYISDIESGTYALKVHLR